MRPEVERMMLAGRANQSDKMKDILDNVSGTFIQLDGGVGVVAEYLSEKGNDVTLQDSNRLSFSYRRAIVPQSKVRCWAIDLNSIKLDKPAFDYVIIRGTGLRDFAQKIAKKGIIVLETETLENVVHTTKNSKSEPKTVRNSDKPKVDESNVVHPRTVDTGNSGSPDISDAQSVVDLE